MKPTFYDLVEENPVIAAVKDDEGLALCCGVPEIRVVFVLYGDICRIGEIVGKLEAAGKLPIIHVDLITGLSAREISVDFIRRETGAAGIISTKPPLIRRAKELGMYTVMRFFVLDTMSLESVGRQLQQVHPDFVELLPGLMPKIIRKVCRANRVPVIAGGLISDKEDILAALGAGAAAISSTNPKVWSM